MNYQGDPPGPMDRLVLLVGGRCLGSVSLATHRIRVWRRCDILGAFQSR